MQSTVDLNWHSRFRGGLGPGGEGAKIIVTPLNYTACISHSALYK